MATGRARSMACFHPGTILLLLAEGDRREQGCAWTFWQAAQAALQPKGTKQLRNRKMTGRMYFWLRD